MSTPPIRPGLQKDIKTAYQPFLGCHDSDVAEKEQSVLSGLQEAFLPTSKAVRHQHPQPAGGAAGAGTPTGEDHTQRTPGAVFGDDVAKRDPKTFEKHVTGPPTAAGTAPTKHAEVKKSHMATAGDQPTSRTPERMFYEELQAKIKGSPEAAGIPRRGVDEPGGYIETLGAQAKERALQNVSGMAELPDRMSRIGEAVGGVISHIGKNAVSIVMDFPKNVSKEHEQESVQHQVARERGGGDVDKGSADPFDPLSRSTHARALNSYDMIDIKPGGQFSDLRRDRIVAGLEDPDPARRRDTLKDKWLYPFSKDAGDPGPAERAAKSYHDYRADKAHEAEELAQRKADQEEKLSAAKQDEEKQEDTGPVQEHKQEGLLQKLGNLFVEKKHGEGGAPHEEHAEEAGKYKEAKEVEEKRETQEEQKAPASGVVEEGAAGPMGKGGVITQVLRWSKGVGREEKEPESSSSAALGREEQTSELGQQKAGQAQPSAAPEDKEAAKPTGPKEQQAQPSDTSEDKEDTEPAGAEGGQVQPLGASKDKEDTEPAEDEGEHAGRGNSGSYSFSQEIDNVEAGSTFSA